MGTIVIDPGHGGNRSIPDDSTFNNAVSASGVLEKNITLDIARRIQSSLTTGEGLKRAKALGKTANVILTREADVNLALGDRAAVAADHDADLFLSIHCNGFDKVARGTEAWIDRKFMSAKRTPSAGKVVAQDGPGEPASGRRNINVEADAAFAAMIAKATFGVFKAHDTGSKLRSATYSKAIHGEAFNPPSGVKMKGLAVLRDAKLGTSDTKCRATLLELEFIDVPAVDQMLNGASAAKVRNELADALAVALVEAL